VGEQLKVMLFCAVKKIIHDIRIGIACVIEAGQPERPLNRLQQREVGIKAVAYAPMRVALVGSHDQRDLVGDRDML
jgi:hypothetical protein